MRLILLGAPASGKGTQAAVLTEQFGVPKISTGDMLRAALKAGTPLGKEAERYMSSGGLVPDSVVIGLVEERLKEADAQKGFILDGFPRTVAQAEALDGLLNGAPLVVVEIRVPDDELVRRVRARRICEQCGTTVSAFAADPSRAQACSSCGGRLVQRSDDSEQVVRDRLKVYWKETQPMIVFYQGRPTFRRVDGEWRAVHVEATRVPEAPPQP